MSYVLTYFNIRARAETSRMLFELAEVEYEDKRVTSDEWKELKPKSLFGQIPMLEVDGHQLCQSRAIERFLAKRFNLYGRDEFEQVKTDMIADCLEDMFKPLMTAFQAQGDDEKAKLRAEAAVSLDQHMQKFENFISSEGFVHGSQISWADLIIFNAIDLPKIMGVEFDLNKYPKVNGVCEKVKVNPKIAEWLKKRPASSM